MTGNRQPTTLIRTYPRPVSNRCTLVWERGQVIASVNACPLFVASDGCLSLFGAQDIKYNQASRSFHPWRPWCWQKRAGPLSQLAMYRQFLDCSVSKSMRVDLPPEQC